MKKTNSPHGSNWLAGIARRIITPTANVELAGLGYYLNRTAERVRDHLTATALVIENVEGKSVALVAMDLMANDEKFVRSIREQAAARIPIQPETICVNFSHSHNAPTAGFGRGVGEVCPAYLEFAARQAVDALVEAWRNKVPVHLRVGASEVTGVSFNRTRENGPIDTRLNVLCANTLEGKPLAVAINFHCHLNAHLESDLRAVSRDWSGEVIDSIEAKWPGVTAMYLQGTCGDVMVPFELFTTDRRFEVAQRVTRATLEACQNARPIQGKQLEAIARRVRLPTRRWTSDEVMQFRTEGMHRLSTGDTTDWLDGIAKAIVTYPARLPMRYAGSVEKAVAAVSRFAVEWSDEMLPALKSRPEVLETEIQAMRFGDVWLVAHEAELFTTLGLEVRRCWPHADLFMLGYSNGTIGYLPDKYDIDRGSYAAIQSPKFTGQFPFTPESGAAMVSGMLKTLQELERL